MKEGLLFDGIGGHTGYLPVHQRVQLPVRVLPRLTKSKLARTYLAMSLTGMALDFAIFKLLIEQCLSYALVIHGAFVLRSLLPL